MLHVLFHNLRWESRDLLQDLENIRVRSNGFLGRSECFLDCLKDKRIDLSRWDVSLE